MLDAGTGIRRLAATLPEPLMDFGALAEVRQLVPFHHDPGHTDIDLDLLVAEAIEAARPPYLVSPGMEGVTFNL